MTPPPGGRLRAMLGMPFGERKGGAEVLMLWFLERAAGLGVDASVVFFDDGPFVREVAALDVPTHVVRPGRFRDPASNLRATRELRRLFASERPDVIFGWITRAHVTFAPAAVAAGLRNRLAWYQWTIPPAGAVERAATALPAQLVVACSKASEEGQRRLLPRRPTCVVYPGIEPPKPRSEAEIDALRSELAIPPGRDVVGISGRLVRWKRQDRVIEAAAALIAEGRDVQCLVVGGEGLGLDPGYEDELRALARRLGVEERVTFTGHVADALPYTQLMDVAVNASEGEPFGLVVLEAMGLAVPVVAVAEGGPAEIVEHGRSGVLVPSAEPAGLAAAIGDLLDDPGRRVSLGLAGQERARTRFTVDAYAAGVRDALALVAQV